MMTIGGFAHASGLTVEALRFYDDTGLLEARDVDPVTGYRRYSAEQLRRAATIKVLRAMGMSLAQVRAVVDDPDRADELVARIRADLAADRARQGAAVEAGMQTLQAYDRPVEVHERTAPEQHWVGVVMPVARAEVDAPGGVESGAQEYDAGFATLASALQTGGNPPVGPFWTTVRSDESGTGGELLMCWPVAVPVGPDFAVEALPLERPLESGTLPPRVEWSVRLSFDAADYPDAPGAPTGDAAPHPTMLALLEHVARHGDEPDLIRQIGVPGPDGVPVGIDIAVTAVPRPPR